MARTPRPWYRASHRQWFTTMNSKQIPLGVSDPTDEARAWDALQKLLGDVNEIKAQLAPKAGVKGGKLPALVAAFLDEKRAEVAEVTIRGYTQHLRWLSAAFPSETAGSLDVKKLAQAAALVGTWGDTYRANVLATVGGLLKWAGRVVAIALPPKASKGADSLVSDDVYRKCLLGSHGDFHQLLRVLWLTGCRPGEATGLTAEAVDWGSGTATLKRHKTRKRGKTRVLFLGVEAVRVLTDQRMKYRDGLLFRGMRGKRLGLQAMTMRFQRLSERIGHKVTSYCFRHTWATRALLAGIADVEVAAMLGHSSTAMLHRNYSHVTSSARKMRENADRLAG